MILPMVGSLAWFGKRDVLSMEPFSSKSSLKERAVSAFTPVAAKTMAELSSVEVSLTDFEARYAADHRRRRLESSDRGRWSP